MVGFELSIHRLFDLERVGYAIDHQLQGVAKKINGMVVFQELRVLLEDLALFRIVYFLFHGNEAFLARLAKNLIQHGQHAEIRLLVVRRTAENTRQLARDDLQYWQRRSDQQASECGSTNDHNFCWLKENRK